jgi:GntR family transcriptional regulator
LSAIQRSSPVPYYEQLYNLLVERIRSGDLALGERLPGESELHRDFGLSRATVRQALDLLESHGWAYKVPRRGYFAGPPPEADQGWLIEGTEGFLESEIGHGNDRVRTRVVSAAQAPLPNHAATALKIPRFATGFVLERLRYVDDDLVLFSTNFTPPNVVPVVQAASGVLTGDSSLTEALGAGGYSTAGAHRVIHALPATARIADLLEVPEGSALLRIRSTTWDQGQTPFDYYETWLRSDRVPLELNATPHRSSAGMGNGRPG